MRRYIACDKRHRPHMSAARTLFLRPLASSGFLQRQRQQAKVVPLWGQRHARHAACVFKQNTYVFCCSTVFSNRWRQQIFVADLRGKVMKMLVVDLGSELAVVVRIVRVRMKHMLVLLY